MGFVSNNFKGLIPNLTFLELFPLSPSSLILNSFSLLCRCSVASSNFSVFCFEVNCTFLFYLAHPLKTFIKWGHRKHLVVIYILKFQHAWVPWTWCASGSQRERRMRWLRGCCSTMKLRWPLIERGLDILKANLELRFLNIICSLNTTLDLCNCNSLVSIS